MTHNFTIILEEEKTGGFSASVPALPGCFSQGDTLDEVVKNAKEAIEIYLENEKFPSSAFPKSELIAPVQIGLGSYV